MAEQMVERLHDIKRNFPRALDLFCGKAHVLRALQRHENGATKIGRLYQTDVHEVVVEAARSHADGLIAAEEDAFTFREGGELKVEDSSLDAVISAGGLHWVNDLVGVVRTACSKLKGDGVFLGVLLGGETLHELRASLQQAEDELLCRAVARTSPTVHVRDAARLLAAARLALPAADVERVVVSYRDMWSVMQHVRAMGEGNALVGRHHWAGRALFERAAAIYAERFGSADGDGVDATFDLIYVIGWKAHGSQLQSLSS
ncbi:Arginine-hydroxylase NDUFAF5, mitochondrial [Gracilariopsis chorda]|uniref:Arginine-hydroxylase NDUFAF5, mitochondrial n=1 Tax=Gracilariopsis chorda TaxID=448386 RepID=A0A2V3IGP4_9FLOR|nr:Arginine-hydroxylase NDUFAF5, mitochondrial [Gracilariopsis chorda]|eukprot:PXF41208.1 Arginine-hydroxylase NDUFAF5, mitochondrial [Gracilariopsis chorda]